MRVKIADGNFSGLEGRAAFYPKGGYVVWLDVLPQYPMLFSQRELFKVAP